MIPANTFLGGKAATASAAGTPTPVVWQNISGYANGAPQGSTDTQTMAGLSGPGAFTVTYTGGAQLYYSKNAAANVAFNSGDAIAITSGDTLAFTARSGASSAGTVTVTFAGTVFAVFTYSLTALDIHIGPF